jgi:hypothetical protein
VALAEDAVQRKAREELERELNQMVGTSPTRVRVEFVSPDEPNYKLEQATFELDGKPLKPQSTELLASEGTHEVFSGEVSPGKHTVSAHLIFANGTSVVLSDEGGYKWKIGGNATFEVAPGIEVQVRVVPARDSAQKDIGKRFSLRMPAAPVMVAKLDDGKMPEPVKAVPTAVAETPKPPEVVNAVEAKAKPVKEAVMFAEATPRAVRPRAPAVSEPQPTPIEAVVDAGVVEVAVAEFVPEPPVVIDAGPPAAPVVLIVPEPEGPNGVVWLLVGGGIVLLIVIVTVVRRRSR